MLDQLELMPRTAAEDRDAWWVRAVDIENRLTDLITYETSDNLRLWTLMGRWATTQGIAKKHRYVDTTYFHIQRLCPGYQEVEQLNSLMAKLDSLRNPQNHESIAKGYQGFVDLFENAAPHDARMQIKIGEAYENGHGFWANRQEAQTWYTRAALTGHVGAIAKLGVTYLHGSEEDVEKGLELLATAVDKGSASAAYTLSQYYLPDPALDKKGDRDKAIHWLRKAAERGYSDAFYPLAGLCIEIDNGAEALKWANGGNEPNKTDTMDYLIWKMNRSKADFDGRCTYLKGKVYALGIGDVEQDLNRARALFKESCQLVSSFPRGAEALAVMYWAGIGVRVDAIQFQYWRRRAKALWKHQDSPANVNDNLDAFFDQIQVASKQKK